MTDAETRQLVFRDGITVSIEHFNPTAKKVDDTGKFHDTLKFKATLPITKAENLLQAMHIAEPGFLVGVQDEWFPMAIHVTYHHQDLALKVSERSVATFSDAELYDFELRRADDEVYTLVFKAKGYPEANEHAQIERAVLDAVLGQMYHLVISVRQTDLLDGTEDDDSDENE